MVTFCSRGFLVRYNATPPEPYARPLGHGDRNTFCWAPRQSSVARSRRRRGFAKIFKKMIFEISHFPATIPAIEIVGLFNWRFS